MPGRVKTDVIVIGAGAAGLAAARELSQQGITVLVVEARERLGGRIHTIHDHGSPVPVELGAEFIHGEPEETFSIVRAASLPVDELPDNRYWSRTGRLYTIPDFWERIERTRKTLLRYLKRFPRRDAPLSNFLASPGLRADDRSLFQNFAEGYHAAYPEKVSARWVAGDPDEESGSDTRQFRLVNGYSSLIQVLRGSLDPVRVAVRLNTIVSRIEWSRGNVTVHCRSGLGTTLGPFKARAALVTIPAAVLRAGIPDFHPQLAEKDRALRHIEGGQVFKMILRFRSAFWDDETFLQERMGKADSSAAAPINFILAPRTPVSTWWTTHPSRSPLITAWAGGPRADLLLNQDPDGRVSNTLEALASALAVPRARLDDLFEHALLHDWRADPYSREAYSYVGVGGVRAQQTLAQPVEETLFFAGEATDAEQTGTVAGALASGDRAARQLRDALEG